MVYDVLIIGGGLAGIAAAKESSLLGKSVCLFEKEALGGKGIWNGMLMMKEMLTLCYGDRQVNYEWQELKEKSKERQLAIYRSFSVEALKEYRIDLVMAHAHFIDANTVKAASRQFKGERVIIATGLRHMLPYVLLKVSSDRILTMDRIFGLRQIPKQVIVHGADRRALQAVELFDALGSKVFWISEGEFLTKECYEIRKTLIDRWRQRRAVLFEMCTLLNVEARDKGICYHISTGGMEHSIQTDYAIVSEENEYDFRELKLSRAGVEVGKKILVKQTMQTRKASIYAVGDCASKTESAAGAVYEGRLAARNAWSLRKETACLSDLHRVSYLIDAGSFGLKEDDAITEKIGYHLFEIDFKEIYGNDGNLDGYLKVIADEQLRIIGAHSYGHNAMEVLEFLYHMSMTGVTLVDIGKFKLAFNDMLLVIEALCDEVKRI